VPVDWHYHATGIDPPELVRYILREHPDVVIDRPAINVFRECMVHGLPTRHRRWCCKKLKEFGGAGRRSLMGIRSAESPRRAKTWGVVTMRTGKKEVISPIIHWSDDVLWWFLREHKIAYCSLYNEGFRRLGCIGCPMVMPKQREMQFSRWPHFRRAWQKAANAHHATGRTTFASAEDLWRWWMYEEKIADEDDCQGIMDFM
jgi:phosphoadenosine phosphosulfate reductase